MKRKVQPVLIGALAMVCVAPYSSAQQKTATTQPAGQSTTGQAAAGQGSVQNNAPGTGPAGQGRRAMGPVVARFLRMQNAATVTGDISDDEWNQVKQFMLAHSSDRMHQFDRLPAEKQTNVKRAMVGRFRMLEETRKSDPKLYEIWVQKLELEDERYILLREMRHPAKNTDSQEVEARLKANIGEDVHLELAEREHRLENLEHALDDEKNKLAEDRKNEDSLAAEQLTKVITSGFGGEGFRRQGGGFRGPNGPNGANGPNGIREASVDVPTTSSSSQNGK